MDNCAIHHDEEIRHIIEVECGEFIIQSSSSSRSDPGNLGAKLIYLPPYSPDFNPIEQAFHTIKSWLRRHEAQATSPEVRPWLIHQAMEVITEEMAIGWIENCGYSFIMENEQ